MPSLIAACLAVPPVFQFKEVPRQIMGAEIIINVRAPEKKGLLSWLGG